MSHVRSQDGFTLIEVLVVLALMVVVVAVSFPLSRGSRDAQAVDAAARLIAASLRQTQASALSSNRERILVIELERLQIVQTSPRRVSSLPNGLAIRIITAKGEISGHSADFRFFPAGGSTGGRILLAKDGIHRQIAVNWLTGAVVVSADATP